MSHETAILPSARQDSGGLWFMGADPLLTKPGNATYITCPVLVPFAHRLLKAFINGVDVDETTGLTYKIMQADDGDAKAGTIVGTQVSGADSSGTVQVDEVTLANADKVETAGARLYWLSTTGGHSNDKLHAPNIQLCVQPVTRSTL